MASEESFEDRKNKALQLKGAVESFTPAYDPDDAAFAVTALDTAIETVEDANTAVDDAKQPWETAVAERQNAVGSIMPLVTQSLAYVSANTAWKSKFALVKRAADKVRGHSKRKRQTPPPTEGPGDAAEKKREQGQRGYMEIAEFFRQYISRLTKLAGYAPASANISLASLNALKTQLDGLNSSIPDLSETLADAIRDRQTAYNDETGLHFVFKGVKAAVKGQYGQKSPQFGQVTIIKW
jgi:hypothetical protein